MKIWPILIGIIVILALVCSPVLAISKSDLIAQYQAIKPPTPSPTPDIPSKGSVPAYQCGTCGKPTIIPTTGPTQVPTGTGTGTLSVDTFYSNPWNGAKVYLDGAFQGYTPLTIPGIPIGSHQVKVTKDGYRDDNRNVTVVENEETFVTANLIGAVGPTEEIRDHLHIWIFF